ncbi:DnaK-related protein, partial [hydrothermal vent metagenome]
MQLSVPNRTTPKGNSFDSNPTSVKGWIDNLPMANIGATTRLLFEALAELNQQDIPGSQRFKTLEMLRKPIRYVTDHMKKHYVGRSMPLASNNLKIAHLSREITYALATGYKVLVMEQIAGVGRRDKKLLFTAMHRAIKQLSEVLLKSYQTYEAYPDSVWLEIHSLYRYAENNGLHKSKITDQIARGTSSSIADVYKQILLLALACPYRMRHAEAAAVYTALEDWAGACELQTVDKAASDALFATNLDTDQPPSYLVLRDANENRNTCRVLNTHRLANRLHKSLPDKRKTAASTGNHSLGESTLRHLMLAWGVMPKRRFSRVRDHSEIITAVGLSSVHYFVSGEAAFNESAMSSEYSTQLGIAPEPDFSNSVQFKARNIHEDSGKLPDVWEMDYQLESQAKPSTAEIAVARTAAGMHIDTSHKTQNWKMINVSAGGYCLLWDNPEATRAQVGELLGIREQSDPDTFHWRLGVIRWLKSVEKRGLELGIQMLSPSTVGIAARADTKGRHKSGDFTRGLLLPEIASIQQCSTLLLPSPPFRSNDTAIINCHGKDIRVQLTKLVENTGSFAQFQFDSLGEIEVPKPHKPAKKPKPKDFD